MNVGITEVEIRHFQLFCGLGGARGFNRGRAQVGRLRARFRCIGGVDVDAAAVRDFQKLAGVSATVLDLFDREQYRDFHGAEPPASWREATPEEHPARGGERTTAHRIRFCSVQRLFGIALGGEKPFCKVPSVEPPGGAWHLVAAGSVGRGSSGTGRV
jgi:hypothetical protein